jgi:hypothetical protein
LPVEWVARARRPGALPTGALRVGEESSVSQLFQACAYRKLIDSCAARAVDDLLTDDN